MSDTSERANEYLRLHLVRDDDGDGYLPEVSHHPAVTAAMLRLRVSRLEAENAALRAELATVKQYAASVSRDRDRQREARSRDRERLAWALVAALVLAGLLTLQFVGR